jgi:(1->4)-alpha-D-glucan 1-alpha-D-glucosylmutase
MRERWLRDRPPFVMATFPSATYRLQLRGDLDLGKATAIVPYLAALGIESLYLSPIATACRGSSHGYDVLDPTTIDPAIGGAEAFADLARAVQRAGLGILLDVVPNHMRAHADNRWWRDVLEHGQASPYADFFDLRWGVDPERRLVMPVLGGHYGDVLDAGELVPGRDEDGFVVRYHQTMAPFDLRTWPVVLELAAQRALGDTRGRIAELAHACAELPPRVATAEARAERSSQAPDLRARLAAIVANEEGRVAVDDALAELGGKVGAPQSFDTLHAWLDAQAWRLAYWRSGLGELNYRRFFDVSDLVALRGEHAAVFEATHALVAGLVRSGAVTGIRVDHVDGLADPQAYLRRLRDLGATWVLVEKILCGPEVLRADWSCDGTTGYELANAVARTFVEPGGAARIETDWITRTGADLAAWTREAKLLVIDELFAPTLRGLSADLRRMTVSDRHARDVSRLELERALRELTAAMPVYRTYLDGVHAQELDVELLAEARAEAERHLEADDRLALGFISRVLRGEPGWTEDRAGEVTAFVRRWQQLSGPVMAKGVEDTLMYRWAPLLALAEVGGELRPPIDPVGELHETLQRHRPTQRAGLCTTATHDTKRGEDVRARLCVLTELADAWLACTHGARAALHEVAPEIPADEDELQRVLQTAVGAWPLDPAEQERFGQRLRDYVVKAAREAKRRTNWLRPDPAYEEAIQARADAVVAAFASTDKRAPSWHREMVALQARVAFHGAMNGLGQLVLKLVAPGVCDVYQGTELWDLSLVDPDNRRPVDFAARAGMRDEIESALGRDPIAGFAQLRERWTDGGIKLAVLLRGLAARREQPELFVEGDVHRVAVGGARAVRVCAVARSLGDAWALGVVARTTCGLVEAPTWPIGAVWDGTTLVLPDGAPTRWRDALTGIEVTVDDGRLALDQVLRELPGALLVAAT